MYEVPLSIQNFTYLIGCPPVAVGELNPKNIFTRPSCCCFIFPKKLPQEMFHTLQLTVSVYCFSVLY